MNALKLGLILDLLRSQGNRRNRLNLTWSLLVFIDVSVLLDVTGQVTGASSELVGYILIITRDHIHNLNKLCIAMLLWIPAVEGARMCSTGLVA